MGTSLGLSASPLSSRLPEVEVEVEVVPGSKAQECGSHQAEAPTSLKQQDADPIVEPTRERHRPKLRPANLLEDHDTAVQEPLQPEHHQEEKQEDEALPDGSVGLVCRAVDSIEAAT